MKSEFQNKTELLSVIDIKQVSKRTIQFASLALLIGLIIIPIRLFNGHQLSAVLLAGLCVFVGVVFLINKKGYAKQSKLISVLGFNLFLVIISFAEGRKSGAYLYYFPLLFALPFLLENQKKYFKEIALYFLLTAACFCVSVFLCWNKSPWQSISDADYKSMYFINSILAIILSAFFAFGSIYFERQFAKALIAQKNRAQEAMKARSQFLSHMGHELRTPLNGIIGATNLMAKEEILPEQEEYFSVVKYCSNHMLELINNILDYNKIEADKLELHPTHQNLKQLLQNTALTFANRFDEKGIELKLEVDEELSHPVLVDDIRLIQIINNLVSNALKFTEQGRVKLSAKCIAKKGKSLQIQFEVNDTGIGIRKEDHHKIFESFGQVYSESAKKYKGSGLGLTITQKLLKLMNSKLELESESGKGSRFYFTLALEKGDRNAVTNKLEHTAQTDLKGMKILIAEDNAINMLIAKKMLENWNVQLTTAENGRQALKALEKDNEFNIVLMDLEMPEMDGFTAMQEIARLYPEMPVLAFTAALVDNEMYDSLKSIGFSDAVLKPFQPLELLSKIKTYAN